MKLLTLAFDWNSLAQTDPQAILRKLSRDHIDPEQNEILSWQFGPTPGLVQLSPTVRVITRRAVFRHLRPLYDFLAPSRVMQDLVRLSFIPDAIIIRDFPFCLVAEKVKQQYGSKVILFLSNLPRDLARTRRGAGMKAAYHYFFEKRAAKIIDAVVAINETTRQYALSLGIPSERIFTITPDTIEVDASYIASAKKSFLHERFNIPREHKILLSVGRLEAEKRFDTLIHAFAQLKRSDISLVIAGEGSLRESLEALALREGVGERVYFAGNVPRSSIWSYYADADAFILLSQSEALGLVVWEAMYMRVPVIVSGAGGLGESVGNDGDRGYIWTEADGIEALSGKLDRCFNNAENAPMVSRAREYVESKRTSIDIHAIVAALKS